MAAAERFSKMASYGLELVDELTGGALVGGSKITVTRVADDVEVKVDAFLVGRSRWVVENLLGSLGDAGEVAITVESDHYLTETLVTNADSSVTALSNPIHLPAVGANERAFIELPLRPRPGYPFPQNLTRAIGAVDFQGQLQPDAKVTITPLHDLDPLQEGARIFVTRTGDDGQYAVWFLPDSDASLASPTAVAFRATAEKTIGGQDVLGDLAVAADDFKRLTSQTLNGAPAIHLAPPLRMARRAKKSRS